MIATLIKRIISLQIALIVLFQSYTIEASALKRIYDSFGGVSNYTSPGGFTDQAAGYYTGGGFAMRQGSTTVQPIQISLPKVSVGCNNMDLFFGSLSFVKGEELARLGKQVLSGAATYAIQLALKTSAPQIEGLFSELRANVLAMNSLMQNSCQMSQQIVGGLWPKNTAASEQICQDVSRSENNMDFFGARNHCKKDSDIQTKVMRAQEKYGDLLAGEYNLVWHVIKKMSIYTNDTDMQEFVLSLVGTIISTKEGDHFKYRYIPPRADNKQFLTAYLKGGQTSKIKCDDHNKCLKPTITNSAITGGLKEKIALKISSLQSKYATSGDITPDERDFLSDSITVPVYKYIQVSAASGSHFLTADATEYIAVSVLLYQFEKIMNEVLEAVELLAQIQVNEEAINKFRSNLQNARNNIHSLYTTATIQAKWMLDQAIKSEEQAVIARGV